MSKTLIAAMILSLPLLSLAEGNKPSPKAGKKPTPTASAPAAPAAPAASAAPQNRMATAAALKRNQSRGAAMGACSKKAAEQKLQEVERKQFIAACVNGR